jgi:hypothetical protein
MHVESQKQRPVAVTSIVVLMIIGMIALLIIGMIVVLFGAGVTRIGYPTWAVATDITYAITAYGLWNGKKWAWTVTLILSVIQILFSILSIVVGSGRGVAISIFINGVFIYWLHGRNVKEFFGRR